MADERRVVLHGFGTEDSHHAISAFTWGPDGGLYMHEGTFHHSQVETPYGPVRLENAGIFRYEPRSEKLTVFSSYPFSNPWGHVFDRWGQNFIADASNGANYFALPISARVEYPAKHPMMRDFTARVRPTAGAEIISSRHFPDEAQGNFLVSNVIGFHGIKNHRVRRDGSGFTAEEAEPLLYSTDINFRPIAIEFGPDGALYIVDWFNPLIGHMQYSLRDPRRDTSHGRIWRLTYRGRPLLQPVDLESLTVGELLDQLRTYEDRVRYRVRRELRERDRGEVHEELDRWLARLDPTEPEHEHLLLEALWVRQSLDRVDERLLARLLEAREARARAAATRVLRYWLDQVEDPIGLLRDRVVDEDPLVRLEAVVALSHADRAEAAEVALLALRRETDYYLDFGLDRTIAALEPLWKPVLLSGQSLASDHPAGLAYLLARFGPEELARVDASEPVVRALVRRAGVPLESRRVALVRVAGEDPGARATELIEAMREVAGDTSRAPVLEDLIALSAELPAVEARRFAAELERNGAGTGAAEATPEVEQPGRRRIEIAAESITMRFDRESFVVGPGEEIELVLRNDDEMPHNLVIVAPGAREKVGRAADAMATRPDGFERQFVPELPEVLVASRLLGPRESQVLHFRAPTEPGDYPYVCTFPSHWLTMFGTMRVRTGVE